MTLGFLGGITMVTVIESILYAVFLYRISDHFGTLSTALIGPRGQESLLRASFSFLIFIFIFVYLFMWKLKGDELGMASSVFFSGFAAYIATEYVGCNFYMPMSALVFALISFGFTYLHFSRITTRDRGSFSWFVRPSGTFEAVGAGILYGLFADIFLCAMVRTYYTNPLTAYAVISDSMTTGLLIIILSTALYMLSREAKHMLAEKKGKKHKEKPSGKSFNYKEAEGLTKKIDELMARLKFLAERDLLSKEDARRFIRTYDRYMNLFRHSNLEKINVAYLESVFKIVHECFERYKSLYYAEYEKFQKEMKRENAEQEIRQERKRQFEEAKRRAEREKGEYRSGDKSQKQDWEATAYTDGTGKRSEKSERAKTDNSNERDKTAYQSGERTDSANNESKRDSAYNSNEYRDRDYKSSEYRSGKYNKSENKEEYRKEESKNRKQANSRNANKKMGPKWSTTYFDNCVNETELRRRYLKLVKIYHPDNKKTGDSDIFRVINSEYRFLLRHM